MAIPWYLHCRGALDAQLHAQIVIDKVELPTETPGEAVVTGRFARVFRGDQLRLNASMKVRINVMEPNDNPPPSGVHWKMVDDLRQAKVLEAYLDHGEQGWEVAMWMSWIIPELTATPTNLITEADAKEPTYPKQSIIPDLLHLLYAAAFVTIGGAAVCYAIWVLVH